MSKAFNLELPAGSNADTAFLRALNERFLLIADRLQLSTTPASASTSSTTTTTVTNTTVTAAAMLLGTHAVRVATVPTVTGQQFYETDRALLYSWNGTRWTYISGTLRDLLANKPVVGLADAGLLFYATDYAHTWRWSGVAWDWAPGDDRSDYFRACRSNPGTGWHLCDGSAGVVYTKSDGTTGTLTVPDLTTGAYLKGGAAYSGTVNAAGTITLSGNTGDTSAGTPAGTNSAPALTMNSYTPAGTFSGNSNTTSAVSAGTVAAHNGLIFGVTTGASNIEIFNGVGDVSHSALGTHSHTVTPTGTFSGTSATLTGSVAAPTFTGTTMAVHHHDLSGASATLTGDPVKNLVILWYFRQ